MSQPQPPYSNPWQQGQPSMSGQGYYYQPPMQPPRSRVPVIFWIIAGLLVIMCSSASYMAGAASHTEQPAQATMQQAAAQPTAAKQQPTAAPDHHFQIGDTVTGVSSQDGPLWSLKVNGVKTSQGDQFDTPAAGNVYMLVDVTMKNISSQEQDVSSLGMWTLRDSGGQEMKTDFLSSAPPPPDGKVEAGSQIRGTLVYQVPTAQHSYTLAFQLSLLSSGQIIWDIKI